MKRMIGVFVGNEPRSVGVLRYEAHGAREAALFEYQEDWIAGGFALDPTGLPLIRGRQFPPRRRGDSVFHSAINDTAPDGWGRRVIMRDHAKRRLAARETGADVDLRPLNDLDYLLAVDDQSRVGAIRLRDENGIFQRTPEAGERTAPPLIELAKLLAASHAVEKNTESEADLRFLRGKGTSLGGLRPKCTVVDESGQLLVGKFPSVKDERSITKAEVLALRLASSAGIDAAEASLVQSDGSPVALIRRFDRPSAGGRLMYVSAATLLGVSSDNGEHSYTEMVDAIRKHGGSAQADIDELWRRIAFSILITNVDDHLHNHGFLHIGAGHWRLAPAFDINPFPGRERELKTWISNEAGPAATIAGLMSIVPYCRIGHTRARKILGEVEVAVSRWREEGQSLGMSSEELDDFTDAFEHGERGAARRAVAA